jgi:YafQ family addiction module toxin component
MYNFEISEKLEKILKKLFKKDKKTYEIIIKKIQEIISSEDPHHYKNLRYNLKEYKRVHIHSHFVLAFKIEEDKKIIKFLDFDHHGKIYNKKNFK